MIARLLATISRRGSDEVLVEHQPAELPPELMQFKPMVPLMPPAAQNDDVMQPVYEVVEMVLRARGYLD